MMCIQDMRGEHNKKDDSSQYFTVHYIKEDEIQHNFCLWIRYRSSLLHSMSSPSSLESGHMQDRPPLPSGKHK